MTNRRHTQAEAFDHLLKTALEWNDLTLALWLHLLIAYSGEILRTMLSLMEKGSCTFLLSSNGVPNQELTMVLVCLTLYH
jgi:hypothetical protein